MSATNSLHYQLCIEGAKWLRQRYCKWVAVELNTCNIEQCDVWGYNGWDSMIIEVKTSHSDFLNDLKKEIRKDINSDLQCGTMRWYLCPCGVISGNELPDKWGLLYWNGNCIKEVVKAGKFNNCFRSDMRIIYSILLREKFPQKIFNYRGMNTTIKTRQ